MVLLKSLEIELIKSEKNLNAIRKFNQNMSVNHQTHLTLIGLITIIICRTLNLSQFFNNLKTICVISETNISDQTLISSQLTSKTKNLYF